MKVSSPVGDLPFKPTKIALNKGFISIEGSMGAWPAHVQMDASDLVDIGYLLRYPLIALFVGVLAIIAMRLRK